MKRVSEGQEILYGDHTGVEHDALCTAVWGWKQDEVGFATFGEDDSPPCVNVVYVSKDESKTDDYGRQIERDTSVPHRSAQPAHGNWWKLKGE
jgi:hypothetical protein